MHRSKLERRGHDCCCAADSRSAREVPEAAEAELQLGERDLGLPLLLLLPLPPLGNTFAQGEVGYEVFLEDLLTGHRTRVVMQQPAFDGCTLVGVPVGARHRVLEYLHSQTNSVPQEDPSAWIDVHHGGAPKPQPEPLTCGPSFQKPQPRLITRLEAEWDAYRVSASCLISPECMLSTTMWDGDIRTDWLMGHRKEAKMLSSPVPVWAAAAALAIADVLHFTRDACPRRGAPYRRWHAT